VSVRWHITGDDKETFEDVWTDWLTQSNPCAASTGSPSSGPKETATPGAAPLSEGTANPQSSVPTSTSPLPNETADRRSSAPTPEAADTSAPDTSTQKQALLDRARRSNRAVTAVYNSLIARVPAAKQEQLKQQQDEWLKMRGAQAGSEELLAQGLNADPNVLRRFVQMNETRTIVLKTALRAK
jgi:uncharacterized protein YecT (DUF1311 family)